MCAPALRSSAIAASVSRASGVARSHRGVLAPPRPWSLQTMTQSGMREAAQISGAKMALSNARYHVGATTPKGPVGAGGAGGAGCSQDGMSTSATAIISGSLGGERSKTTASVSSADMTALV